MLRNFLRRGKASFIVGGQYGSEGKGAAAAFVAANLAENRRGFDIITTNAGAQAGHTSTHQGKKRVVFHLPTASLIEPFQPRYEASLDEMRDAPPITYLNAGSIIDPLGLEKELAENPEIRHDRFFIHPNAAVITDRHREAEGAADSAQTKIASTRKGVGQALADKVLRSAMLAKDHPYLAQFVTRLNLNSAMAAGNSVLVEVPQGISLSLNSQFYPHVTSRNCTVTAAMADADIHPSFMGATMLILRTFPIRVGHIPSVVLHGPDEGKTGFMGQSGGVFPDQTEIGWEDIGVEAEITTVTKRVRRVFTWSEQQAMESIKSARPDVIYLTFCDYIKPNVFPTVGFLVDRLASICRTVGMPDTQIITQWGPTTEDAKLGA